MSPEEAFKQSSESITGPITKSISKSGILKMYEGLDKAGQDEFKVSERANAGVAGRCGVAGDKRWGWGRDEETWDDLLLFSFFSTFFSSCVLTPY